MLKRLLKILAPLILIELVILFFLGLAYSLMVYCLSHLIITSAVFIPGLYKTLAGTGLYEKNRDKITKQVSSVHYRFYWFISNIAYLVITIVSFQYNFKFIDIFS